jgi:hypothetical protein
MAWGFGGDPGWCPVCDAPHTACTSADYGPIVIAQLPMRDAAAAAEVLPAPAEASAPAEETFTTKTYRRRRRP